MYIGYLTPQRRTQLISAGFDFTSLTERQFQSKLRELEMFQERYGHCMVPEKWEENVALGAWVSNLRSLYRRRTSMLLQQEQEQEEQSLQLQQQQDGKEEITTDQKKQRMRSRNNILKQHIYPIKRKPRVRTPRFSHLDDERIELLEDMGFVWSSTERKWLEMLEWAKVYAVVTNQLREDGSIDGAAACDDDGNNATFPMEGDGSDDNDVTLHLEQQNGTEEQVHNSNTLRLLDNYYKFVRNNQNQSLLTSFHPQDKILALLLEEETYAQKDGPVGHHQLPAVQQQLVNLTSASSESNNNETQQYQSLFEPSSSLDYRIPPNDTLHQSLRIWMINQRSNYNRLPQTLEEENDQSSSSASPIPSTMTPQRQHALEEIHFPWSGRFRNRMEEVQYKMDKRQKKQRQTAKKRRMERKERAENERVEQLLISPLVASVASTSGGTSGGGGGDGREDVVVEAEEEDEDIMALWGAEEEDEDDW